jgi:hypothetical protein
MSLRRLEVVAFDESNATFGAGVVSNNGTAASGGVITLNATLKAFSGLAPRLSTIGKRWPCLDEGGGVATL